METIIESPHFKVSPQLNDFITTRVSKLEHLNERLILCEILLKIEKSSSDDNKLCEIKLFGPQIDLFASHHCTTFEDAVTDTLHALEQQIKKEKEKTKSGRHEVQMGDTSMEEPGIM